MKEKTKGIRSNINKKRKKIKTETKTVTGKQAETQIIRRKANTEKTNKKEMNNGG